MLASVGNRKHERGAGYEDETGRNEGRTVSGEPTPRKATPLAAALDLAFLPSNTYHQSKRPGVVVLICWSPTSSRSRSLLP
jgi:hypothetical protein